MTLDFQLTTYQYFFRFVEQTEKPFLMRISQDFSSRSFRVFHIMLLMILKYFCFIFFFIFSSPKEFSITFQVGFSLSHVVDCLTPSFIIFYSNNDHRFSSSRRGSSWVTSKKGIPFKNSARFCRVTQ